MHRLAPATFEVIARSGVRCHNAANKAVVAAELRNYIIQHYINSLAAHYESLLEKSSTGEKEMVTKFLRSGLDAARQHREYIAQIVNQLFIPTPGQPAMNYVKKTEFEVDQGKAIIAPFHQAMIDLCSQSKGDRTVLVTILSF